MGIYLAITLDSSCVNSEVNVIETTIEETSRIPMRQAITPMNRPKWVAGKPSPNPTVVIVITMSHMSFAKKEKS